MAAELRDAISAELGGYDGPFSHGQNGEQLPNPMVLEPYLIPPHVSLGWNAVRSTDTPRHGGAPARRADPAVPAVWAPHKLDLGRLLGPQVTPGPNGGLKFRPLASLISPPIIPLLVGAGG